MQTTSGGATSRALLTVVALSLSLSAGSAQQPPATLTPLDYFEINQLYARYAHGMDNGEGNGATVADVFTPTGVYIGPNGQRVEGRERILAFAREDAEGRKGVTNVSHLLANVVLEPSPQGATGRSYVLFAAKPLPGEPRGLITAGGQYFDDLVRTVDGWRIQRRVYVPSGSPRPELTSLPAPTAPPPVRSASSRSLLTAEDYVGIYQLYADYGHTYDTATNKGYDWANLYTPDGVHVATATRLEYIQGRDLLAAFAYRTYRVNGEFAVLNLSQAPVKTWVSAAHNQTSIVIDRTAEGVVARPYRITGGLGANDNPTLIPGGVYHDLLVKDPDRWRFKESWYVLPGRPIPDRAKRFIAPVAPPGAVPPTQGPPQAVDGFTPADYVEIQQLYARSAYALDSAGSEGTDYARLYTPDGVFADGTGTSYRGTTRLAEFARTGAAPKGVTNVEHVMWQVRFSRTPDGVRGVAYVMTVDVREAGKPAKVLNVGQYRDELVQTPNGWRIQSRSFHRAEEVR